MSQKFFRNALISVADKTGLVEFVKPLADAGMRVVSTGGTARVLREAGVPVTDVSEQTGFPEVMDGRVKTLHPRVHMALLARLEVHEDEQLLAKEGLAPFDLVIGNLYPFADGLRQQLPTPEMIELIDIGGPSLLRAAAKNFSRITVLCDPRDYSLAKPAATDLSLRRKLAARVFAHTSSYDARVAEYVGHGEWGPQLTFAGELRQPLRYGENPHQRAAWYADEARSGWHEAKVLQGKELSYNNLLDLDAAAQLLLGQEEATAVVVKHNNPCGAAQSSSAWLAVEAALAADPVSAFGGIMAINRPLDAPSVEVMSKVFLECVVAPLVTEEARELLKAKKNLRVLEWPKVASQVRGQEFRSICGGFLVQSGDGVGNWSADWRVIGGAVDGSTRSDLLLAWKVAARLKSNAIALVHNGKTVGLGMGQVNRVDAVHQAIGRWRQFHSHVAHPVAASDGFFPFADSLEALASAGVRWIIQPGGSVRDGEIEARVRDLGLTMIFTGERHFSH